MPAPKFRRGPRSDKVEPYGGSGFLPTSVFCGAGHLHRNAASGIHAYTQHTRSG